MSKSLSFMLVPDYMTVINLIIYNNILEAILCSKKYEDWSAKAICNLQASRHNITLITIRRQLKKVVWIYWNRDKTCFIYIYIYIYIYIFFHNINCSVVSTQRFVWQTKNFASCRPRHGLKLARHSMMSSSQRNQLWALSNLLNIATEKKEEGQASRVPNIRSNFVGGNFSPETRPIFHFW